jgi:hypothetical protein
MAVDDGRLTEEEAARNRVFSCGVAVSLGSRSTSTKEDAEVEASTALDSPMRAWQWPATAKQVAVLVQRGGR